MFSILHVFVMELVAKKVNYLAMWIPKLQKLIYLFIVPRFIMFFYHLAADYDDMNMPNWNKESNTWNFI